MTRLECSCSCGHTFATETQDGETVKCPECGSPVSRPPQEEDPAKRILTDSYIEAAYEVLAEEGAIWSGAR
jgi:DNA-directed RNA polymerase subunit RPC12/RpoP